MEMVSQMLWPLLACFVLVGIHAYLGIHIIERKVIFVDLALAQIAGLGAVYAVFIGLSLENDLWVIKAVSVGFTLLGALLFAFCHKNDEKVPHEAIIGIIYASALSLMILLMANLPHGAEDVQQMLAGNILWVTPKEVLLTALLYAVVGVVHIIFRKPFFALSRHIAQGKPLSFKERLWDFLFYATFGVVVTSSVGMGGVLLVFGYLVVPSVIAVMFAKTTKMRLLIAWGSALIVSTVGVFLSYQLDLPSGPSIVVLLAIFLVLLNIASLLFRTPKKAWWPLTLVLIMGLILILPLLWREYFSNHIETEDMRRHQLSHRAAHEGALEDSVKRMLSSSDIQENIKALNEIKEHRFYDLLPLIKPFLLHVDSSLREMSVQLIANCQFMDAIPWLKSAFSMEKDQFIKIDIADTLASLGDKEGLMLLALIAESSDSVLARDDAIMHLQALVIGAPAELAKVVQWLRKNQAALSFDKSSKKYQL